MLSQMSAHDELAFTPKLLGRTDWQERTEPMLGNFELAPLATRFPLGLSKGQRQRLAYAAVTAAGPPVLIFDEPTTGIDQPGYAQIMQYMDALRREQKTIVFITHDMPLAMRWADRIVVMHNGRVVHTGPPESLARLSPERLKKYHLRLPPVSEVVRLLGISGHFATPAALVERLNKAVSVCGAEFLYPRSFTTPPAPPIQQARAVLRRLRPRVCASMATPLAHAGAGIQRPVGVRCVSLSLSCRARDCGHCHADGPTTGWLVAGGRRPAHSAADRNSWVPPRRPGDRPGVRRLIFGDGDAEPS